MLVTQALCSVLRKHDDGFLDFLPQALIDYRIPMVLIDILCKTLKSQELGGGWGNADHEVSSYAVLTLTECVPFSWAATLNADISSAISRAKRLISTNSEHWQAGNKLWIEKVAYSSPTLRSSYYLAALRALPSVRKITPKTQPLALEERSMTKVAQLFATLPLFIQKEDHARMLSLAVKQSLPLLSYLRSHRLDIFPQKAEKEDKYLMYIPLTWTACNAFGASMPLRLIQDMALLSMLNYQVDEYMEAVVQPVYLQDPKWVRSLIYSICEEGPTGLIKNGGPKTQSNGAVHPPEIADEDALNDNTSGAFNDIRDVLSDYVGHFVNHPSVQKSPRSVQKLIRRDLAEFLHAHITQTLDNERMASTTSDGKSRIEHNSVEPFWTWVHGTGALHTSCPLSFTFYGCLISDLFNSSLVGPRQQYLAADLQSHLSAMCRMYNDWGSERRDRDECNLNCLDFPGFRAPQSIDMKDTFTMSANGKRKRENGDESIHNGKKHHSANGTHSSACTGPIIVDAHVDDTNLAKQELMRIAEYERRCLETAFQELEATDLPAEHVSALRLFVDVTDLYGQVYVARDIGVATKPSRSS
jgi:hypothetical protein